MKAFGDFRARQGRCKTWAKISPLLSILWEDERLASTLCVGKRDADRRRSLFPRDSRVGVRVGVARERRTANGDGAGSGWHSSQKPFCVLMEMNSMFAGSGFNPRLCHSLHHQLSSSNTALFFTDALTATKHAPEGQKESGRAFLLLLLLLVPLRFCLQLPKPKAK